MRGFLAYLWYVLRHKWYVALECWRRGLLWRGLVHDFSKFRWSEFAPYARYFYNPDGTKRTMRDKTGYYKPADTGDQIFDFAWFLHQKRNDHHWQWWIVPEDDDPAHTFKGSLRVFPMSKVAAIEMFCDWKGAGRAQGTPDTRDWYEHNRAKLILHPSTRAKVEQWLEGGTI